MVAALVLEKDSTINQLDFLGKLKINSSKHNNLSWQVLGLIPIQVKKIVMSSLICSMHAHVKVYKVLAYKNILKSSVYLFSAILWTRWTDFEGIFTGK